MDMLTPVRLRSLSTTSDQAFPFPKTGLKTTTKTCDSWQWSKTLTIRNNDKLQETPIVVLLGWGHGELKHLIKYSSLFEKHNFTTICQTLSLREMIFAPVKMGNKSKRNIFKILDQLTKKNKHRPIFFMCFSQTGCLPLWSITKHLTKNKGHYHIAGTIFDSCPFVLNEQTLDRTANAVINYCNAPNKATKWIIRKALTGIIYFDTHLEKETKTFHPVLRDNPCLAPQLFLFSKNDDVTNYKDILKFQEDRRNRGVPIHSKMWSESAHVSHLRLYPEEYKEEIDKFIKLCLDAYHI